MLANDSQISQIIIADLGGFTREKHHIKNSVLWVLVQRKLQSS